MVMFWQFKCIWMFNNISIYIYVYQNTLFYYVLFWIYLLQLVILIRPQKDKAHANSCITHTELFNYVLKKSYKHYAKCAFLMTNVKVENLNFCTLSTTLYKYVS